MPRLEERIRSGVPGARFLDVAVGAALGALVLACAGPAVAKTVLPGFHSPSGNITLAPSKGCSADAKAMPDTSP